MALKGKPIADVPISTNARWVMASVRTPTVVLTCKRHGFRLAGDEGDNCPPTANPEQSDIDTDGRGDLCDPDDDGDGVDDEREQALGTNLHLSILTKME